MLKDKFINAVIGEHEAWLTSFDEQRLKNFRKVKKQIAASGVAESATCEAFIARYLRNNLDHVEPYEKPDQKAPDYRCVHNGKVFFVEATKIDTEAVSKASWIPDDPKWEGGSVGTIAEKIRSTVSGKVGQCAESEGPTLVAVGILHSWVTMDVDRSLADDVLISDVSYTIPLPSADGIQRGKGEFVTSLRHALFMAVDEQGVKQMRQRVSGVLVFGLGYLSDTVIGFLNSHALRPFDPQLLPNIEFAECVVIDNRPHIRWHNEKE